MENAGFYSVREYWGTLSVNRSELKTCMEVQLGVYKGVRDKSNYNYFHALLSGVPGAIIGKIFNKMVPYTIIATTLYNVVSAIEAEGNQAHANILLYGHTVLTEIKDALERGTNYERVEAKVFFREYTDRYGSKATLIYGNSNTKGKNNGAYRINRMQLTNGQWITIGQ